MAGKKGPRSPRALAAAAARKERGDRLRVLFARNLKTARNALGVNQSELARAAGIGRDLICNYERAHSMPNDAHLAAIAKVLQTPPEKLLPGRMLAAMPRPANPEGFLQMQRMEDGLAWLQVNQRVPMRTVLQVLALLDTEPTCAK